MRMSMSTTSGLVARAALTASRPSPASATTSISPGGLEHGAKAGPHQRLVVGDEQAELGHQRRARSAVGMRARTRYPLP